MDVSKPVEREGYCFIKSVEVRNQKSYNKFVINLVCSICTGKYLPFEMTPLLRGFVCLKTVGKYFHSAIYRPLLLEGG